MPNSTQFAVRSGPGRREGRRAHTSQDKGYTKRLELHRKKRHTDTQMNEAQQSR